MSSDAGQTTAIRTIGRYRVFGELGRGAMGVVYRGFDPVIGRTVALKTLLLDTTDPQAREFRERLYREAAAAGALSHPGIVTIFDVVEDGNVAAVAMEFIEGQSLSAIIRDHGPLPLDLAMDYFSQICSALDFAGSAGIIHRDIKPANILVTGAGRVKVTDFGVAKLAMSTMTQAGTVLGSPSYMSPEQVRGLTLDPRSDLFSAAVVFYEMITKERPFAGTDVATTMYRIAHEPPTPPGQFNAAINPQLSAVLERALAKTPDSRFATGAQMADELRRTIGGTSTSLPIVTGLPATPSVPPLQAPPSVTSGSAMLPPIPTGAAAALPSTVTGGAVSQGIAVPPVIPPLAPAQPPRTSGANRTLLLAAAAVVAVAAVGGIAWWAAGGAARPVEEPPAAAAPALPPAGPPAAPPAQTAPTVLPPPAGTAPAAGTAAPPAAPAQKPSGTAGPNRSRTAARPPAVVPLAPTSKAAAGGMATPPPTASRSLGDRVYEATEVDERARVLRQVPPEYPPDALRRRLEDVVVLRVLVGTDGRAREVQVLRGSQKDQRFEDAAVASVQFWVFAPARKGGAPVSSWYSVGVPFQLKR